MYKGDLASYIQWGRGNGGAIFNQQFNLECPSPPPPAYYFLSLTHKLFQPSHISAKIAFHTGIWKNSKIVPYKGNGRRGASDGRGGGSMVTVRISILNLAGGNYMLVRSYGESGRNVGVW
jgi:hypothetical protein